VQEKLFPPAVLNSNTQVFFGSGLSLIKHFSYQTVKILTAFL